MPPNDNEQSMVPTADVVRVLKEGRLIVAGTGLVGALCGLVMGYLMTPVYRSKALLVPVVADDASLASPGVSALGGIAALAGVNLGGGSNRANEAIALLMARAFTEEFIRENNLLPLLFSERWDENTHRWRSDLKRPPTLADGFRLFDKGIRRVTEDRRTGFVTLSIEWRDPEVAAEWARALIDAVNRHMRNRAIAEAQQSLEFLQKELRTTNIVEVQQAIYRLMEVQIKTVMLANVREQYSFRVIDPPDVPAPTEKVKPKRKLLVFLGMFGGLSLGILTVVIRHLMQKPVRA